VAPHSLVVLQVKVGLPECQTKDARGKTYHQPRAYQGQREKNPQNPTTKNPTNTKSIREKARFPLNSPSH